MKAKSQRSATARKPSAEKQAADQMRKDQRTDVREAAPGSQVQGEGNYEAARRFNDAERQFVETADVDEAARAAQPSDPQEAREMERAERDTRAHAKDEDPQLRRPKARSSRGDSDIGETPPRDRQDERAKPASPDGDEDERYAG